MIRALPDELAAKLALVTEEFAAKGPELRITEVAASTGISRTTLYYYFPDHASLLGWFLGCLLDRRRGAMAAAFAGPGSPVDRLAAALECQLWFIAEHPDAYRALMSNLSGAGGLTTLVAGARGMFHEPAGALVDQARPQGWFAAVSDTEASVAALFGAVTIAGLQHVVVHGHLDVALVASAIIPHLIGGLGPPPKTKPASAKPASTRPASARPTDSGRRARPEQPAPEANR